MNFKRQFSRFFKLQTGDASDHAEHYLRGLTSTLRRKNIERMEERVGPMNYEAAQRFISESPWDEEPLLVEVARQADGLLGGQAQSALYLDETAVGKKGNRSVGVARQYNGRLGKIDNCQVIVSAALGCGERVTLIDHRLYLPKEWIDDPQRCEKAGIPPEVVSAGMHTKWELALELVDRALANGVRFQWVGADGGYGQVPEFLWGLVDRELEFMVEVHSNQHVHPVDPQAPSYEVREVAAVIGSKDWTRVAVRPSTKGPLTARFWRKRIWIREPALSPEVPPRVQAWWLLVREDIDGTRSYVLSNASAQTTLDALAKRQAGRYWIERAFEDAKTEVGLAQSQVRGWRALHHHLAMCVLALLFITKERLRAHPQAPLVSAHDVVDLLDLYLHRPAATETDVIEQIARRHAKRQQAIDSAQRKANTSLAQLPPLPS